MCMRMRVCMSYIACACHTCRVHEVLRHARVYSAPVRMQATSQAHSYACMHAYACAGDIADRTPDADKDAILHAVGADRRVGHACLKAGFG